MIKEASMDKDTKETVKISEEFSYPTDVDDGEIKALFMIQRIIDKHLTAEAAYRVAQYFLNKYRPT